VADGSATTEHLEIAFPAPDRATVDDFHREGLASGGRDAGSPAERPGRDPSIYGAALADPQGTRVESVFRQCR
jgi:predicted lactoylglutathione lyase